MAELSRFETREPKEDERATHMIEVVRRMQARLYRPGGTLRGAHPKHNALVEAEFTVEPDLPGELAIGLFAHPGRYAAWVRFSNAFDKKRPDKILDLRGVAIKVRGVPGAPIPENDEPGSQDFVLMQTPVIPPGTVKLFHDTIWLVTEWSRYLFLAKMLLTGNRRLLRLANKARVCPSSPADVRYWSTTPYLLGPDQAVKYSLDPTSAYRSTAPDPLTDDYLTDNLETHLARADATFDFKVQLQTDPKLMPVEDSSVEWPEEVSSFRKVATLRIPRQAFRTKERDELSEALTFCPSHALVAHRPIGGLNRVRMRIYKEQSAWRHQRDGRGRGL